jgi:glutamate racemase
MLARSGLMRDGGDPDYTFSTTGSPDDFATIGRRFLGSELLGATQFAGGMR